MVNVEGDRYTLQNTDVVRYVDAHYPHAVVDVGGHWCAEAEPEYLPIVGPVEPDQAVAVFSSDQAYFPGLIPALFSFRAHHPHIHIVVFDCGLTTAQGRYLQQFAEVVVSGNYVSDVPAWARFEVSLLPYARVVYLDSDIIVLNKLSAMFDTDAEFAAVRNLDWKITENFTDPSPLETYGISPDVPAFFAGGFSIDNRVWGGGRLLEESLRVYQDSGTAFLYADQSALQLIMHSRNIVTFIGDEYNAIAACWDWEQRAHEARVIHYAGDEIKPWDPRCQYPGLDYFFAYSKIRRV
jgi:lipopolysaccharide biosynthesis glycosyltransferase